MVAGDPEQAGRFLVKRVGGTMADGARRYFELLGENEAASRDSRAFGLVPAESLEGVVVWRYLPAHRRGRLPSHEQQ